MEVIAKINISTPAGRKIVQELEKHKKLVKITYPVSDGIADSKTFTHEEFLKKVKNKFSEVYGVDFDEV